MTYNLQLFSSSPVHFFPLASFLNNLCVLYGSSHFSLVYVSVRTKSPLTGSSAVSVQKRKMNQLHRETIVGRTMTGSRLTFQWAYCRIQRLIARAETNTNRNRNRNTRLFLQHCPLSRSSSNKTRCL